MARLSVRAIEALKPRSAPYIAFDDDMPGYGVRVMTSGVKTFVVQYRANGRTRRMSFGRFGTITPDEARREARELLALAGKGKDPAFETSEKRRSPTVASVCERFLKDHVESRCKPKTHFDYESAIRRIIIPKLGAFKAVDVRRPDIAKLHHQLRETPYQANRVLSILSKLFNLSEIWGLRPDGSNPCRHVKKYAETRRERFLSPDELRCLGEVLDAAGRQKSESPHVLAAFALLVLTGCRLGEIQTLRWDYVEGDTIALPDSKTGSKRVYLGKAAQDILARIPRLEGNPYVIAGKIEGQYCTDLEHPWRRIREAAGLEDVRIHDLRHSFASSAVTMGENLPMIGKLLGHRLVQTTARYAHLADDPVKASAERVSSQLARSLFAPSDPANDRKAIV